MDGLNKFIYEIGSDSAFSILARSNELLKQGKKVINLGIGQPDFPTAPNIVESAVKALRDLKIDSITDRGGLINLSEELVAIVPKKHMVKEDGSELAVGEETEFKVIECNGDFKRIVLSHTSMFKKAKPSTPKKPKKKDNIDKSTLGDIEALADLKKQMEDEESKS